MRTGQDMYDTTLSDRITATGNELLGQLMESAVINAALYAASAGRDNMSGRDTIIALQYEAREFCNRVNLNNAPNDEPESEDESDDSDDESVDESPDDPSADVFTKSYSDDPLIQKMNYYHETWDMWEPELPIEKVLKNAVDAAIEKFHLNF